MATRRIQGGVDMSKFMDEVRAGMRTAHDGLGTEAACVLWAWRFILFQG